MSRLYTVSFGDSVESAKISKVERLTWEALSGRLTQQPPESTDKAFHGWYCLAEFDPVYRHGKNLLARHALMMDYDHITRDDVKTILQAFEPFEYAVYTTHSHTPEKPRLRVVLPLSRPAGADEYCAVSRKIAALAGIELASRESHVPAQCMFLPAVKPGGEWKARVHHGEVVDVDATLSLYTNWTDRSSWPKRADGDATYSVDELPTPPDEKAGIVGDFCRAFNVISAIERFKLPYVPTNNPDRWTYTKGSRPEGAVIYDDARKLHSHHDTDPARGQHNAFDLTRLHRFGSLDAGDAGQAPITERPSFRAMVALAMEQSEVRAGQTADELDDLGPVPERNGDQQKLDGGVEDTSPTAERVERFRVVPAEQFTGSKKLQWIIKGFLPKGALGVIYGKSGAGKSFKVLDILAHVQLGRQWRGLRTKQARGVVVVAEGAGGARVRFEALAGELGVPLASLPGVIPDAPNLADAKDVAALTKALLDYGPVDIIVIDTLAASFIGNENSGEDLGLVLRHCKFIHERTGAMVWLVHHSGKDESKGARGWSGLRAAADVEMEVSRNGDIRTLFLTKLKDGEDSKRWGFTLKRVVLGKDEDGDDITSCVVVSAELPEQQPEPLRAPAQMAVVPMGKGSKAAAYEVCREILMKGPQLRSALLDAVDARIRDRRTAHSYLTRLVKDGLLKTVDGGRLALPGMGRVVPVNDEVDEL